MFDAVVQAEGSQDRNRDAQSGRPAVHQHLSPAPAVGHLVSKARIVIGGVVADLIREAFLFGHDLCSDPRLAAGKQHTPRVYVAVSAKRLNGGLTTAKKRGSLCSRIPESEQPPCPRL